MYIDYMKNQIYKRLQVCVTQLQHKGLLDMRKRTGMTVTEHVRRAVDDYLEKMARR